MKFKGYFVEDIPRRKFLQMSLKGGIALAATPSLMTRLLSSQGSDKAGAKLALDPQLLRKVIKRALEKGGEFADIYVENRISRSIEMEESKFKSGVFSLSQGAGVRVISGDKTGFVYTDDISEEKLMNAAEVASFVARGAETTGPLDLKKGKRKSFIRFFFTKEGTGKTSQETTTGLPNLMIVDIKEDKSRSLEEPILMTLPFKSKQQ